MAEVRDGFRVWVTLRAGEQPWPVQRLSVGDDGSITIHIEADFSAPTVAELPQKCPETRA